MQGICKPGLSSIFIKLVSVLFFTLFLSSCSSMKKDGPPDFYVDETKIPNAVPKPEPLSKYGNVKSYTVFGKKYYTLKSSRNYDEVGRASWYGTKFHARKTSSGEPYDLLSMTAAHKTLPLPTYVEVTNLNNQRRVIVKVNDRGPFAEGRIIDLSYVAAKKLGMLGHGTTKVRVRAINPSYYDQTEPFFSASSQKPTRVETFGTSESYRSYPRFNPSRTVAATSASTQSKVYLQVGAFRSKSHALRLQNQLRSLVSEPVNIHEPSDHGTLYRVKVGPFKDLAARNVTANHLKRLGITN